MKFIILLMLLSSVSNAKDMIEKSDCYTQSNGDVVCYDKDKDRKYVLKRV